MTLPASSIPEPGDPGLSSGPGDLVLETRRLVLRKMAASDLDWLWELDQDPEVMRYLTGGVPTPRKVTETQLLPRMLRRYEAGPQYGFYRAELSSGGPPVGWFHLRPERWEPFAMELGYRLRRSVWGQGLATEGSCELIRWSLGPWNLPGVAASTLVGNAASRRVMEKCGMRHERDFLCPAEWLPGFTEDQRRSVRYWIGREP